MSKRSTSLRMFGVIATLCAGLLLAGCGGEGTSTSCDLTSCTVTFDRGVDARVEILGVSAELVGVEGDTVTLEVAGAQVQARLNEPIQVEGFQVEVQKVTDSEVVVRISQGGSGG